MSAWAEHKLIGPGYGSSFAYNCARQCKQHAAYNNQKPKDTKKELMQCTNAAELVQP